MSISERATTSPPDESQVNAIKPIYDEREFEEQQQKNSNVLSYRRSMSVCFLNHGIVLCVDDLCRY